MKHGSNKIIGQPRLSVVLQTESAECGSACVSMIAKFHGLTLDLAYLRQRFPVSLKGVTLAQLMKMCAQLNLAARPVRLDVEDLGRVRLPCILHWEMNHFVVLERVGRGNVTLHDPARGRVRHPMKEVVERFTGVALEIWPGPDFSPKTVAPKIELRGMLGKIVGFKRSIIQVILLSSVLEVFAVLSPLFLQWVVDHVIVSADADLLTTLAIGFGLLLLIQQAIGGLRSLVVMNFGTNLSYQSKANVFNHLLRLPTQYFEKRHIGDVISRFGSVDTIQQTLSASLVSAILDGVMTCITLTMMFAFSLELSAIAVSAMILYGIGRVLWYRPLRSVSSELIVRSAKTQSHFLETMRGIKAIQLFGRRDDRRSAWLSLLIDQINVGLKSQKLKLIYQQGNGLIFGIESILIIWLGAKFVMDGLMSVGMLMAFNSYKSQFNSRVGALIDNYFELKMLSLQSERLADIVLAEPMQETPIDSNLLPGADPSICLKKVEYRYAHGEATVLKGIDLTISAGESVALTGKTGSGKTTLINIILGVLTPTQGSVFLGATDVKHMGITSLRSITGTVTQDDVLFAGSISENISFFDPAIDIERVKKYASICGIHDEVVLMPMGYNTLVGDMGTSLSGGQKQRILLARALYMEPRILVLDEATCHLDVDKEAEIVRALNQLPLTKIYVAHRPELISSADRVLNIKNGYLFENLPNAIA
ncbi:ABC transporter [Achromobacter sp. Root83]|uniref:peptidase domain-containing ABC transporter n=1 Tax=Achromobacter sp. Root83 TaxID=1736602 RepID=UPI000709EBA3|nr:peptidase domain-containing ABC transporter [Achromobacter sp. Root83]KRC85538.1 ABC transporter [Achromobacter sp. Root83]